MSEEEFAPGQRVTIQNLQKSAHLNGRHGTITGTQKKTGRLIVRLDAESLLSGDLERIAVKRENLLPFKTKKSRIDLEQCHGCFQFMDPKLLKTCTGCKVTMYCSAECQKRAWPKHKAECKLKQQTQKDYDTERQAVAAGEKPDENTEAWRARAEKAIQELLDVLYRQGIGHFKEVITASKRRGISLLFFDTPQDCRDFATQCVLTQLGRSEVTQIGTNFLYRPWPQDENDNENIALCPSMSALADKLVGMYNPKTEAVVFVVAKQRKGSKNVMMNGAAIGFSGTGNLSIHSKSRPKFEVCSDALTELGMEISTSPKYRKCRQTMLALHKAIRIMSGNKKGMFVIRNIFNPKDDCMERKDLKAVTPKRLLKAVEQTIKNGKIAWHQPVTYAIFDSCREHLERLAPSAESKIDEYTRVWCEKRGCTEDELMETHFGFCISAYVETDDDLHIHQVGMLNVEGVTLDDE